jgi:hypothetical protein
MTSAAVCLCAAQCILCCTVAKNLADVADARPLGIPALCAIVGVARLWHAKGVPLAGIEEHEDKRAMVPADAPDGIGGGVRVTGDAAEPGDVGELIPADDAPIARLGIFFRIEP